MNIAGLLGSGLLKITIKLYGKKVCLRAELLMCILVNYACSCVNALAACCYRLILLSASSHFETGTILKPIANDA